MPSKKHTITIGDKIRSMNNRELAEFLFDPLNQYAPCKVCPHPINSCNKIKNGCIDGFENWFNQEYKGDNK